MKQRLTPKVIIALIERDLHVSQQVLDYHIQLGSNPTILDSLSYKIEYIESLLIEIKGDE